MILIIGTLDTKEEEIRYLKQEIEGRGHKTIIMDVGTQDHPLMNGDITSEEVAKAAGFDIQKFRMSMRSKEMQQIMIKGAIREAKELYSAGKLCGIITIGGATNAFMGSSVMKEFPLGLPKLIVAEAGMSDFAKRWMGSSDIALINSVASIGGGLNVLTKDVICRAAGAICGMADVYSPLPPSYKTALDWSGRSEYRAMYKSYKGIS